MADRQLAIERKRADLIADQQNALAASETELAARLQKQIFEQDEAIRANAKALSDHQETMKIRKRGILLEEHANLLQQQEGARALGENTAAERLDAQLDNINDAISQAATEAAAQQFNFKAQQEILNAQRAELKAQMETARDSADTAALQKLNEQLAEQDRVIAASEAALISYQGDLLSMQAALEAERQRLLSEQSAARVSRNTERELRLQDQLDEISLAMAQTNASAFNHKQTLEAQKATIEAERSELVPQASKPSFAGGGCGRSAATG